MFKIAVFPKCYIKDISTGKMSVFEWIEMAKELEPEGLELYSRFLTSFDDLYLREVRKKLGEYNFEMPMMCYSPDFTNPDSEIRQREINSQKEIIKVTSKLGGRFCRILSGQKRPEVDTANGIKWVVDSIKECLKEAENCNIVLVMENHYKDDFWIYPEFAQRKEIFLTIINQIDSEYFGVQFDPSNAIVGGYDPVEFLIAVKGKIKTMHASDRYLKEGTSMEELRQSNGTLGYSPNLCHGIVGKGLNNYYAIMGILKEVNFNSWISIEDGMNGMEEMKESVNFLKRMREKYFG